MGSTWGKGDPLDIEVEEIEEVEEVEGSLFE